MENVSYPGVYNREVRGGPGPIQGASVSTLALISFSPRGPLGGDKGGGDLVFSYPEYERKWGSFNADSVANSQAQLFFLNGGSRLRQFRVVGQNAVNASGNIVQPTTTLVGTGDNTEVTFTDTLDAPVLPGSLTVVAASVTLTDDGSGALTGAGGSGTIDYLTGDISVTFGSVPANLVPINATYDVRMYRVILKWPGSEGNGFTLRITGLPGSENDADATFDLWTVAVLDDGSVVEQFDGVTFDDADSPRWWASVINDTERGSAFVSIQEFGLTGLPSTMAGTEITGETVGTGNGTNVTFSATLAGGSLYPGSLVLTTLDTGDNAMGVTDDRFGSLVGDTGAGSNVVTYSSGALSVTFEAAVKSATAIAAAYYTAPDEELVVTLTGGANGDPVAASDIISGALEATGQGIYALDKISEDLLVIVPDFAGIETVDQAVLDFSTSRKNRFAILSAPDYDDRARAADYKIRLVNRNNTSFGAMYWPWIRIADPLAVGNLPRSISVSPVGAVAGVYARTSSTRGLYKAPAGTIDGALRGILGLSYSPSRAEVGLINPIGLNALVDWEEVGSPSVWGVRTLELNGEYPYVATRLVMMFLQSSVFAAAHRYVFEPNGPELWTQLRLQIGTFMRQLFNAKWFQGETPEEAYFVTVDATNNPPEVVNAGQLYVDVGFADQKPAEFVILRYQRKTD